LVVSGERKYYLPNLPAETPLEELAATIKARWVCEQAHQQLKEELGLDHFEGRSWTALHRHALMTMIALAFLQHLRREGGGKSSPGSPPGPPRQPTLPAIRRMLLERLWRALACCPNCGARLGRSPPDKLPK
jgi:SRSO17 transposase